MCSKHRLACKNICKGVIHCKATGEGGKGECLSRKQLVEAGKDCLCIYHLDEDKIYHIGFQITDLLQTQSKSMRSLLLFLYVYSQPHCVLAFKYINMCVFAVKNTSL